MAWVTESYNAKSTSTSVTNMIYNDYERNHAIPLTNGVLETQSKLLTKDLTLKARLSGPQFRALARFLLEEQKAWHFSHTENDTQTLYLTINGTVGNEAVKYRVDIIPTRYYSEDFVLSPLLPEKIATKVEGGTSLDENTKGIEGVNPNITNTTLEWAKTMKEIIGFKSGKMDYIVNGKVCGQRTCIKPMHADVDRIISILMRPNVAITLDYDCRSDKKKYLSSVKINYQNHSLNAYGSAWLTNDSAMRSIRVVSKMVNTQAILEAEGIATYEQYYRTEMGRTIKKKLDPVATKVGKGAKKIGGLVIAGGALVAELGYAAYERLDRPFIELDFATSLVN